MPAMIAVVVTGVLTFAALWLFGLFLYHARRLARASEALALETRRGAAIAEMRRQLYGPKECPNCGATMTHSFYFNCPTCLEPLPGDRS